MYMQYFASVPATYAEIEDQQRDFRGLLAPYQRIDDFVMHRDQRIEPFFGQVQGTALRI